MFMDGSGYKYEPIYENWRDANTPDYWYRNKLTITSACSFLFIHSYRIIAMALLNAHGFIEEKLRV